ncbi:MAG TPA: hypothetical protein VEV62_07185 [Parafilimonas sp.]|nr:hypothetical protein [Parafilimonas sp.]
MDTNLTVRDIRIRAFRATEDRDTCLRFIEGHKKVLEYHGIYNVSSSTPNWLSNPSVFVIVVESLDCSKLYGGARIQAADGKTMLPIETAVGEMDPQIHKYIAKYAKYGTGELCGLWNSIEVAGLGIGSYFPARAAIVIIKQLGFDTLFSLCSPATLRFNQWIGSRPFTVVGNMGTFYYPKLDLLATAVFLEDAHTLNNAHPREREKMLWLRQNLSCINEEKSPFKNVVVKVRYELEMVGVSENEFKIKFSEVNM